MNYDIVKLTFEINYIAKFRKYYDFYRMKKKFTFIFDKIKYLSVDNERESNILGKIFV